MITKEQIQEVINKYDGELKEIKQGYEKDVSLIENDTRFTDEAKKSEIQKVWDHYKSVETKTKIKQNDEAIDLLTERREKAVEEFEKLEGKSINESKLTEKDVAYVSGMLLNADDETLKGIAEQYDYDIHILNLINSRDSNKSDYINRENQSSQSSVGVQNREKLVIKHPLELVKDERVQEDYPSAFTFNSAIPRSKPFTGLWED